MPQWIDTFLKGSRTSHSENNREACRKNLIQVTKKIDTNYNSAF